MALANATFAEILDDLSSRFIINVPEEELASVERICFQIEQAHWFYEDFVREQNPSLPSFNLKNFSAKFFNHCPLLHQWSHEHEKAFADFMQYKIRVPVCGAIMLNDTMEKCVLVKGWSSRSGWGFPKGKINKDEPDSTCAAREVLEETGYDISPLIKEQDYVELTIREQRIRLYIVVGVSEDTEFCPKTRKEISKIEWHKVADLPTWIKSRDRDTPYHCGGGCVKYGSSRFYMVVPFVSKLRNWLRTQRKIARKKATEPSNHEESTEVVIFNGHAAASSVKETSPETSVPGTDSEGSAHEQSPNIGAQLNQFSPQTIDSQNILNSILCVNRSTSTQPTNNPIEELVQFKQNHSYFSTGPIIDQSPQTSLVQMKNTVINDYSATLFPQLGNLQISNTVFSDEHNVQKNYSKGISRSNSQTPIQNKNNRDITAPIPIHANANVAIAALDPEQKLRQNSLLSLFAASTSARPSSSTPLPSISVEFNDTQRRSSLLNVLQPDASIVTPSENLTRDTIVQRQLQQFK
ncbi:DCP2-domain-containing protein [Rhizophagus clarus]|uniref:DCP2-domain-containing protein n=1 Tax=Rhizophagus clarus TaxID=94130 RepID=A0A8H3LHU4_9GLOM|nr:DCP2-domain-containing protein [Rhizophagus clarus]